MKIKIRAYNSLIILLSLVFIFSKLSFSQELEWQQIAPFPPVSSQSEFPAVTGSFVAMTKDVVIFAGGIVNEGSEAGNRQRWLDDIWVLTKIQEKYKWIFVGKLDSPLSSGSAVSTEQGVVCIGGLNKEGIKSDVFKLSWDADKQEIIKEIMPDLPQRSAFGSAAYLGNTIYYAGGIKDMNSSITTSNFWRLDPEGTQWQQLPPWPGKSRALNITIAQHNGQTDCIYIIGGVNRDESIPIALHDIYEFTPLKYDADNYDLLTGKFIAASAEKQAWYQKVDLPMSVVAGNGVTIGQGHISILSESVFKNDLLKVDQGGLNNELLSYHTITDTWVQGDKIPIKNILIATAGWDGSIIAGGWYTNKGIPSPGIWKVSPQKKDMPFGMFNFIVLILYLAAMVAIGFLFSSKNKTTDDFFRGGQQVPWWASGLSIFATMLSSITFLAIPAKAYATDWVLFFINMAAVLIAPFVVFYILPFFRNIDATSAYEYLEKRFNVFLRLFGSTSFIIFQIGRMAIVMFLPALALATITPLSVEQCILIMGILSVIYCTMGGIKAVIWTDTLQTFVLLGGALLSYILIVTSLEGGIDEFWSIATAHNKFHLVNWEWEINSITTAAFWVVLLGGLGQQLVPYASDQAIVQRYMSVVDKRAAAKAIWTNAITVIPASLLFFGIGTALFVFYKTHPTHLDPTFQTDAIFALFIARELPIGIAGLVVAGIFAAAQSTISTSMNSTSTAIVTDFIRRFNLLHTEKAYLLLARLVTFTLGCLGTGLALLFASSDVKSLWDSFMAILGLFGGSMCGLFLLGIFTQRANAIGALIGALVGAIGLAMVQQWTEVSFLLYASVGICLCFIVGYIASFFTPKNKHSIKGLTIYTLKSQNDSQ